MKYRIKKKTYIYEDNSQKTKYLPQSRKGIIWSNFFMPYPFNHSIRSFESGEEARNWLGTYRNTTIKRIKNYKKLK